MLRVAILGSALFVGSSRKHGAAAAQPIDRAEPATTTGAGAEPGRRAAGDGRATATAPARLRTRHAERRGVFGHEARGRFTGRVVPEAALRKEPLPMPSGNLELACSGIDEAVKVNIYNEDGSYNIESLRSLDHVLRCRRTDDEKPIEPRLFTHPVARLRSLRRQAARHRLRLPQPAQEDQQPLQGDGDRHPHRRA